MNTSKITFQRPSSVGRFLFAPEFSHVRFH